MNDNIALKQVDTILKTIFDETKVQLLDSVYEKSKDFYKLVFSVHSLDAEIDDDTNTIIAHTKFIFRTNIEKTELIEKSFWYLKDINCVYSKVDFTDSEDLTEQLHRILNEKNFGHNLKGISNFISEAPSSSINDFLSKSEVNSFSVTSVQYNPILKMTPCKDITFDFDIQLDNGEHIIKLSIKKDDDNFKFFYYINDKVEKLDSDDVSQLPQLIGDHLIILYKKFIG